MTQSEGQPEKIKIELDEDIYQRLKDEAAAQGITVDVLVSNIVMEELGDRRGE